MRWPYPCTYAWEEKHAVAGGIRPCAKCLKAGVVWCAPHQVSVRVRAERRLSTASGRSASCVGRRRPNTRTQRARCRLGPTLRDRGSAVPALKGGGNRNGIPGWHGNRAEGRNGFVLNRPNSLVTNSDGQRPAFRSVSQHHAAVARGQHPFRSIQRPQPWQDPFLRQCAARFASLPCLPGSTRRVPGSPMSYDGGPQPGSRLWTLALLRS